MVVMMIIVRFLRANAMIIVIMEELVTVTMMTYRRNSTERKIRKPDLIKNLVR